MARPLRFDELFRKMPLIAILRGVTPAESEDIVGRIIESGIWIIEIPLNSPEPFASIKKAARRFSQEAMIGAGTVLNPEDVERAAEAGAEIIVSPNVDDAVVRKSKALDLVSVPGVMTPSEAFAALAAGADVLKFFPGELLALSVIRAYAAVLPEHVPKVLVGGVSAESIRAFANSPVSGFGIGSSLYRPGMSVSEVSERSKIFVEATRLAGFGKA